MELFNGANSFAASFLTGAGDNVDMKTEDIFLYTLLPFGQLIMRIYKYGGSLDKPYLLLLMAPAFKFMTTLLDPFNPEFGKNMVKWTLLMWASGFITPLLGYLNLIKSTESESIIDLAILIPIGIRVILIAVLVYFNFEDNVFKKFIVNMILFSFMMFTNFIHLSIRRQCNPKYKYNGGKRFLKVLMDSFFQYAIILLILGIFAKTKFFAYELYDTPVPFYNNVGEVLETIVWISAAIFGYILTNMFDANYNTDNSPGNKNDDVCQGDISDLRCVISSIMLVVGLLYYYLQNRYL
jgi:hypothetical protein